jgi:hydroxymethylpyrimidine pyrophosphatase-like HAD family hydrolase/ABC-type dipeptide/oligopeptide/nickel transport system ATPase component
MRYFCLCCDYDGTIARDGQVAASTIEALKRVSASGRKLILNTGRELNDLLQVFPDIAIFDRVVAENGGLLYRPATRDQKVLADPPPREFVEELGRRGVNPLSVGNCIVSTWHPNETIVLDVIRTLGLGLQVTFNKGAVMILPAGVNKGSGLLVALEELKLSPHNVVSVGDAENDHAFMGISECSVAVANALDALKDRVDFVIEAPRGAGVEELIDRMLSDDLQSLAGRLSRHQILLGRTEKGEEIRVDPYGSQLLIAGPSGSGKSTTVSAIVERLLEKQYQICVIDPEGDYDDVEQVVTLGGPNRVPGLSEIQEVLNTGKQSLSINLLGVPLADRPSFFQTLLSRLQESRSQTGRPHWIIIDEAHHLLPAGLDSAGLTTPKELANFALITVHPDHVSQAILSQVNGVIAVGPDPRSVFAQFNAGSGQHLDVARLPAPSGSPNQVVVWQSFDSQEPVTATIEPAKTELRRHRRKYAAGELGEDKSFYFRGPDGKLNLRAQNMNMFTQLAEGVDTETWTHHLHSSDYSRWLRESVKDQILADEVGIIEQDKNLDPSESRRSIIEAIRKRYTAPA